MKRLLAALLLCALLAPAAFAEIGDEDGFDWVVWDQTQKIYYVLGFLSAYHATAMRVIETAETPMSEGDYDYLSEIFHVPLTVGQIVEKIDAFYHSHDNRRYELWRVLLLVSGKDYWN